MQTTADSRQYSESSVLYGTAHYASDKTAKLTDAAHDKQEVNENGTVQQFSAVLDS